MTDKRRGGGEQRGAGARRRTGTRLTVEGDVVMEDADENPSGEHRTSGGGEGRRGGGIRGRRRVRRRQPGCGTRDVSWVRRTAWGRKGNRRGAVSSYGDGAEREVVTSENAGEGGEQRGARARTCSSLRGRKVLR